MLWDQHFCVNHAIDKTSLREFLVHNCDEEDWMFSKSWEFLGNVLGILWEFICLSRFFFSRFCLNGEEGRRAKCQSLEVQEASSLHLKTPLALHDN